jgi:hypothetical protein
LTHRASATDHGHMARACGFVVALVVAACSEDPTEPRQYDLVDSLGLEFSIDTRGSSIDWEYPLDHGVPTCASGQGVWGGGWNRFIALCSGCSEESGGYSFVPMMDCRLAVCDDDDSCAAFDGRVYECIGGICQDRALVDEPTIFSSDAEALCAAEFARGDASDFLPGANPELDARRDALDCADHRCPLPLPDGCLQPGA